MAKDPFDSLGESDETWQNLHKLLTAIFNWNWTDVEFQDVLRLMRKIEARHDAAQLEVIDDDYPAQVLATKKKPREDVH